MTTPDPVSAPLTPARRKALKARAHPLHPVVTIGDKGLTPAVLREIDVNLRSHELIKVKAATDERAAREAFLARICAALDAQPVQHIGKILVIHRPKPEPAAEPAPPPRPAARPRSPARRPRPASAGRPAAAAPARRPTRTAPSRPGSARRPR